MTQNAYETGVQKNIPAVLLYAFHGHEILMLHRDQKWNGLGGKLELGESPLDAAVREFKEESGIETQIEQWHWLGEVFFPNFKPQKKQDWSVTIFWTELSTEQKASLSASCPEGTLHWVPLSRIDCLNLWEGDHHFIPGVLNRTPFSGFIRYQNGRVTEAHIQRILSNQ